MPRWGSRVRVPFSAPIWRHSQAVRQRSAKPLFPSSILGVASNEFIARYDRAFVVYSYHLLLYDYEREVDFMLSNFLIHRFIKDYDNVTDTTVRGNYGRLSGITGIIVNTILCIIKMGLGVLSGAISIVADAIHNLADAGSSIVTLLGFKLAARPADAEHPYGHGRLEYVAGLCIAVAIIIIGIELLKNSILKIISPSELSASWQMIAILLSSIGLQMWLGRFNKNIGITINSAAIRAAATDSLSDCVATSVVVISLLLHFLFGINIDGWAGLLVAAFILHSGISAAKDTLQPLLGQPPDPELIEAIESIVKNQHGIIGIHDLIINDYGPGRIIASLHAEVPSHMSLVVAHEMADNLEQSIKNQCHILVSVHMDPVETDDPFTRKMKEIAERIVSDTADGLSIHDFRISSTKNKIKLVFDVSVPPDCPMSDDDIKAWIRAKIHNEDNKYVAIVNTDRFFF